jgi:uncharacterized protein Smg (DUF494 family)
MMYLEQIGILSAHQRELVIDRLMALDCEEIDVDDIKWVVLMVLFSQPGEETAYARMEDLVFEERPGSRTRSSTVPRPGHWITGVVARATARFFDQQT